MVRKTTGFTAGIAALALTIFAGAEGSGANAQVAAQAATQNATEAPLTEEVVPVFVEKAVVQELPGDAELPTENSTDSSASSLRELVSTRRLCLRTCALGSKRASERPGVAHVHALGLVLGLGLRLRFRV